jgi:hypothetical protein
VISFATIRARAEKRKGGAEALAKLMAPKPKPEALLALKDDRILAEMTKRVLSAGFLPAGRRRASYSMPSDFSLRCSAERSMPMNSAVREMLPPNRLIWATR